MAFFGEKVILNKRAREIVKGLDYEDTNLSIQTHFGNYFLKRYFGNGVVLVESVQEEIIVDGYLYVLLALKNGKGEWIKSTIWNLKEIRNIKYSY